MSQSQPDQPDQPDAGVPGQADGAEKRYQGPDRRQSVVDRRYLPTGLERRRGPGRRRSDFAKSAEEGQMSQEQFLFIAAIDVYKRVNQRPFPTWTEVLEVIRKLGYRKTAAMDLQLDHCEDWTEAPDAPAFSDPPQGQADFADDDPEPSGRADASADD